MKIYINSLKNTQKIGNMSTLSTLSTFPNRYNNLISKTYLWVYKVRKVHKVNTFCQKTGKNDDFSLIFGEFLKKQQKMEQ